MLLCVICDVLVYWLYWLCCVLFEVIYTGPLMSGKLTKVSKDRGKVSVYYFAIKQVYGCKGGSRVAGCCCLISKVDLSKADFLEAGLLRWCGWVQNIGAGISLDRV